MLNKTEKLLYKSLKETIERQGSMNIDDCDVGKWSSLLNKLESHKCIKFIQLDGAICIVNENIYFEQFELEQSELRKSAYMRAVHKILLITISAIITGFIGILLAKLFD